jgi:hypothetical protein
LASQDTLRFRRRAACFGVSKIGAEAARSGAGEPLRLEFLGSIIGDYPFSGTGLLPAQSPNQFGNRSPTRGTRGVGHIDKTTLGRGRVLSMLLLESCSASLQAFAASLGAGRTHLWIEKCFKRLCCVEKPATPFTRNPVLI